jgi:phage terminase small subunit
MAEDKPKRGRPKKARQQLVETPEAFLADEEAGITEMQASFVWHYTEGACGQTEAARRAGFSFPASAATKMLDGKTFPKVTRAVRVKQDELREKYAVTPQKTGAMLWKIAETSFENGAYNAAVSAVKELNQLAGLTIHRSQNLNINADLQKMTKEDIKARLNELLGVDSEMRDRDH